MERIVWAACLAGVSFIGRKQEANASSGGAGSVENGTADQGLKAMEKCP